MAVCVHKMDIAIGTPSIGLASLISSTGVIVKHTFLLISAKEQPKEKY